MRKIILEGVLGEKFGYEWNLDIASPVEAIQAITSQRKGFRSYLAEAAKEGLGFEILFGDEKDLIGVEEGIDLIHPVPLGQTITFVPVIMGSDNQSRGMLKIVAAAILIAVTYGQAAPYVAPTGTGATISGTAPAAFAHGGYTATTVPGLTAGQHMANYAFTAASNMGWGLMIQGVSMLMMPNIVDPDAGEEGGSYLFNGAENTVKQGVPVPVVYGRVATGSATVSASIFTGVANSVQGIKAGRKHVGIPHFRTPGAMYGNRQQETDYGYDGCFDKGTLVQMADGTEKAIELIELGDMTKGGQVYGTHKFFGGSNGYNYNGVILSGTHWVVENGRVMDVQDSILAKKIDYIPDYWYSLTTEDNRIWANNVEFYDEGCMDFTSLNKYAQALINKDEEEIKKWAKNPIELSHGFEERYLGI
jgi:predicted phage tail protein